jgi:sugar-phosphatase
MSGADAAAPRALLSDLDGVLVDSTVAVERSWRAFAARHGLDGNAVIEHAHGIPSAAVIAHVAPHVDVAAEAERVEREQVDDVAGVRALPGARELLEAPPARFAVVTSCTAALAAARLAAAGLPTPAILVTADRLRRGKPDPEGYLMAAGLLGVDPAACLVLEDAPAGVAAGRAAGMTVAAVLSTHAASDLGEAHHVVAGVSEALALLAA